MDSRSPHGGREAVTSTSRLAVDDPSAGWRRRRRPRGPVREDVSPHDQAWHAAGGGVGRADDSEPGSVKHRLRSDERHRRVHPPRRIDGVGLHRGRAVRRRVRDRPFQQWCRHTASAMPRADDDAHDAPHRQVVNGTDQPRAGQTGDLGARTDVAPSHRFAVEVGHHPRRLCPLAEASHGRLSASAAELLDLG